MTRSEASIRRETAAARDRGTRALALEPRAASAHFDRVRKWVIVELTNGAFFGFPPTLIEDLRGASEAAISAVEVSPSGEGLHWESIGVDLLVPSLMQGAFGSRAWMRELGRVGGRSRSEAKAAASRKNGKKGGRPRGKGALSQPGRVRETGNQAPDLDSSAGSAPQPDERPEP